MQFLSGSQFSGLGSIGSSLSGLDFGLGFGELGDLALSSFNSCASNEQYRRRMWYALQFDTVMADSNTTPTSQHISFSAPSSHSNIFTELTSHNNSQLFGAPISPISQLQIMDTNCASPPLNTMDSRKRNADRELENGKTKRTNHGDNVCQIKILIPSYAAGAIIGKGGETIAQIQKDTGAKIKMSKANDFYPGTSDRVCLISGDVEEIKSILKFIMEKIRARPDNGGDPDREKQMKVLVPNSTAGMIIGKGGAYVKQLQEESGAYVQLSQKAKELQERCITVSGHFDQNEKALDMILDKVAEDPSSGSCPNVSYADVNGPIASVNPTGSPFANTYNQQQQMQLSQMNNSLGPSLNNGTHLGPSGGGGSGGGLNFSLNFNQASPLTSNTAAVAATLQLIEHMKVLIGQLGYSDQASAEISAAMATLAKYNILGLGLGTQPAPAPTPSVPAWNQDAFTSPGAPFGGSSTPTGGRNFALMEGEAKRIEIEVPEAIVGAILGPGGRSLNDIMNRSGANVQISKKGVFAPGTKNRVVTIQGSFDCIAHARLLIDRKINDEEWKRSSSNSMSTD